MSGRVGNDRLARLDAGLGWTCLAIARQNNVSYSKMEVQWKRKLSSN